MINIFVLSNPVGVANKGNESYFCRFITLRDAPGSAVSGFIVGYWGDDGMEYLVNLPSKVKTSLSEWALRIDEKGNFHHSSVRPKDFVEIEDRSAYIFAANKEEAVKVAYETGFRSTSLEWHDLAHYEYLQNRKPEDIPGE